MLTRAREKARERDRTSEEGARMIAVAKKPAMGQRRVDGGERKRYDVERNRAMKNGSGHTLGCSKHHEVLRNVDNCRLKQAQRRGELERMTELRLERLMVVRTDEMGRDAEVGE
jgi:hypothetical protein